MARAVSAAQRKRVADRAGGRCEYCLSPESLSLASFEADHIRPRVLGGESGDGNLAYCCRGCNSLKGVSVSAVDALTATQVPLFNPRADDWAEHFSWSEDGLTIIGNTAQGRATIEFLQLNRPGVVSLRRLMRMDGTHPAGDFPGDLL